MSGLKMKAEIYTDNVNGLYSRVIINTSSTYVIQYMYLYLYLLVRDITEKKSPVCSTNHFLMRLW
jgi:hypothetical protein